MTRTARVMWQCAECKAFKNPGEQYEEIETDMPGTGVKFIRRGRGEPGQYRALRKEWTYMQRAKVCLDCSRKIS